MSKIDPTAVAARAGEIVHQRELQRKRATTEAAATMFADVMELLEENPMHPVAVAAAAILSRKASSEDVVTALRAIYGADFDQAVSARPANAIPGTAQRRIPILKADGSEDGSVAESDNDERLRLEGQGYKLTRRADNSYAYRKTDTGTPAPDTLVHPRPPATPLPSGPLPLFNKQATARVGTVTPEDGRDREHEGELVAMRDGDNVMGYRYARVLERR